MVSTTRQSCDSQTVLFQSTRLGDSHHLQILDLKVLGSKGIPPLSKIHTLTLELLHGMGKLSLQYVPLLNAPRRCREVSLDAPLFIMHGSHHAGSMTGGKHL